MNQASKKLGIDLRPGSVINGKWHRQVYVVQKRLGQGAIGAVYLCKRKDGKISALKISEKAASITTEVNVLKHLAKAKVQGTPLGPSLFDVDDWIDPNGMRYSFYVMEYIQGKGLSTFLNQRGEGWLGVLLLQLLKDLERLHQHGWVFGDLKMDNVIVASTPPRLRWIDVGGTTQIGRSIKEYTEFYDRGYWQAGSRKAEPSYDLFALAMIALHYAYPNQFERGRIPTKTLQEKVRQAKILTPYQDCLQKALQGSYKSSIEMQRDLSKKLLKMSNSNLSTHVKRTKKQRNPSQKLAQSSKMLWLESFVIIMVASFFFVIYYIAI